MGKGLEVRDGGSAGSRYCKVFSVVGVWSAEARMLKDKRRVSDSI